MIDPRWAIAAKVASALVDCTDHAGFSDANCPRCAALNAVSRALDALDVARKERDEAREIAQVEAQAFADQEATLEGCRPDCRRGRRAMRRSIEPTYDHRETGDRFDVETRLADRRISLTPISDPFVHHRVVVGWWDALRLLVRHGHVEVTVVVGGDREIVEDVLELNDDYTGRHDSTRQREWEARVQQALAADPSVMENR